MRMSQLVSAVVFMLLTVVCLQLYSSSSPYSTVLTSCPGNQLNDAAFADRIVGSVRKVFLEEVARHQPSLPTVYVVTPTYKRLEQIPELTRMGQTLLSVPKIHWIVADDSQIKNEQVLDLLNFLAIPNTYLLTPMPDNYRKQKTKPKGVANRNAAMEWIRENANEGVMYLADDDNTYDIRLFAEIRYTKRVSMVPVGLVTGHGLSTPVVKDGTFMGWYDGWIGGRKFPVDMAGFAVSVDYLKKVPNAKMPFKPGYEEDGFLKSLNIKPTDIEFLADNCSKIYVWHTKTTKNNPSKRDLQHEKYNGTNLRILEKVMTLK